MKNNNKEIVDLLREQERRAQLRESMSETIKLWGSYLAIGGFSLFLIVMFFTQFADESSDSSGYIFFFGLSGILILVGGVIWLIGFLREP